LDEKREIESELGKCRILFQGKKDMESRMKKEMIAMQRQINEKIHFSQEKLDSVSSLLFEHKRILDDKNSRFLQSTSLISVLESKKERPFELRNKIVSLENCPTCLQKVEASHKCRIEKQTKYEIEEINRDLISEMEVQKDLAKEIEAQKKLIENYETDKSITPTK